MKRLRPSIVRVCRAPATIGVLVALAVTLAPSRMIARGEAAGPLVRVHGTETWQPTVEVALDEVALFRAVEPRRAASSPTLVANTSLFSVRGDSAAVRLAGVTTLADLVAQAKALRDANPGWDARLVLYSAGAKRNAKSRRLLTDEIVVVGIDGAESRQYVPDPLDTLEIARTIAARPDVRTAEPVAAAPDYLRQRLARKLPKLQRQDKANERQTFFALKLSQAGEIGTQALVPINWIGSGDHSFSYCALAAHSAFGRDCRSNPLGG